MDQIREEIKRIEKEIAELKKLAKRKTLKEYLNNDLFEVSPIGCLHHIARAHDGEKVYHLHRYGDNAPIYALAKCIFKFRRVDEIHPNDIQEVADFCNEIITICNKYAVNKYIVNFDRERFDEAYQDIIDYLGVNNPKAIECWEESKWTNLEYIMKWREELNDEETLEHLHR